MTQFIEIEGDLARIVDRTVTREVPLADVMRHIETRQPLTTPLMPNGTKLSHLDPTNNREWQMTIMVEVQPLTRMIEIGPGRWGDTIHPTIALPWTVFAFHIKSVDQGRTWSFADYDCFHSRTELTGDGEQKLIPAMLPNVYNDGRICWGNTAPRTAADASIATRINQLVNEWYRTTFTDHRVREHFIPWHGRTNYNRWERETNANARAWETWPEWDDTDTYQIKKTVNQILTQGRIRPARTTPIILTDGIPDLAFNPTFGRAEQWFGGLNATQRHRMRAAIRNYDETHDPTADAGVAAAVQPTGEEDEDA